MHNLNGDCPSDFHNSTWIFFAHSFLSWWMFPDMGITISGFTPG